ncbi:MAG: GGDEF domain-containing protein, partial [Gammaproteobacteria bacterium]|nr:GGDEF domain-containing protein [Gammaproteobacteria bacterium]
EQSQILYIPQANLKHNNVFNAADGNDYISYEIVHDEVIFVHRLNRELKYKVALYNSILELFLLLSSLVMVYMIYYLRVFVFRVEQLANTDPLTLILNRRAMENAVLPLMRVHQRYKQKMCFLLADVDYFKKVNDTYGHAIGDEVLIFITGILKGCLRSSDLLSRHGGEEFLIVLPQTDLESGSLLAERIRTSIENTRSGEHRVAVTISIGCTEVRENEDFGSVITRADSLLYEAKNKGRNQSITSA